MPHLELSLPAPRTVITNACCLWSHHPQHACSYVVAAPACGLCYSWLGNEHNVTHTLSNPPQACTGGMNSSVQVWKLRSVSTVMVTQAASPVIRKSGLKPEQRSLSGWCCSPPHCLTFPHANIILHVSKHQAGARPAGGDRGPAG